MKTGLTFAEFTNRGSRSINEDCVGSFITDDRSAFVLCDGLGGHGMGDVASGIAVDVFGKELKSPGKIRDVISAAFDTAQKTLLSEQSQRGATEKMKTTATVAVSDGRYLHVAHVGDSRVYVFGKKGILTRTTDHSIPQMLALSRQITEEEIRFHPDRNMLLRVMGTVWHDKEYEFIKPIPLRKVQAVLLCSDGFWELIDEECMCRTLQNSVTVEEWLDVMVKEVQKNGDGRDMDNYSAIAVRNIKA